jgi:hypothetical protein
MVSDLEPLVRPTGGNVSGQVETARHGQNVGGLRRAEREQSRPRGLFAGPLLALTLDVL